MDKGKIDPYHGPAGGWGSVRSLGRMLRRDRSLPGALPVLLRQNKPGGVACVSCAWAKPAQPHTFEFCENGAKATSWENMGKRLDAGFFARHDLARLRAWSDHELEAQGRLTEPMRWDAASGRYVPVQWEQALTEIGQALQALPASATVFYTSGRASLETSYMYQLLARLYGNNNLPDSSNMCHETTSVALPHTIGVPVGTVHIEDFDQTECLLCFGQNTASNSPRMLHLLQSASRRGVPIITFNPLHERGLEAFKNPQAPTEMLRPGATPISSRYHQVKTGGDIAALLGLAKALLEQDEQARHEGRPGCLDRAFIAEHTDGFDEFARKVRACPWEDIERNSGLVREALRETAAIYGRARSAIALYGMGLTQHRDGVDSVQMLVNVLLMRGNIGKPGAGICPVRGHSNVQGQRTVGITEKPELAPLDRLAAQYGFEPPREKGLDTVGTCHGVLDGSVRAFVALGGNFLRAAPDTARLEAAWPGLALTVHITTTLNRSHLFPGQASYLLPCLGRTEIDEQASGPQTVSTEDSTGRIHASRGISKPAGEQLRSEPAIVAGIAQAIPRVARHAKVPWREWVADYGRIRDAIEQTYPESFAGYNRHLGEPGGFALPNAARERRWNTETGRARFFFPSCLTAVGDHAPEGPDILQLMTLRSNDQFNTTVYDMNDRFRGIYGTREIVLMNPADIARLGLQADMAVTLSTALEDGHPRHIGGLRLVPYDIPQGCCAAYYPECNVLVPLWHHARDSHVPAAKSVPVRVRPTAAAPPA
ncbi:FdhF/YdeP family oxidoreductase [Orrella sp. JC864]|uniref:FdhF/YdeP family oxidoreductase n=1 Tax=Orrella sp. JC864 TaxID=3120298 RepID=UPI00300BCBDB